MFRIAPGAVSCLLLVGAGPGAAAAFSQDQAPLPEGNAYVRGVLQNARPQDAAINDYAYDIEEAKEDLDGNGRVTSRESRRFEVYYVKSRPVRRLVARNGVPLGPREQKEVDRKADELAKAIAAGRTVSEQIGIRLGTMLDSFDFKTVSREQRDGRAVLVLDFTPRPGVSNSEATDTAARAVTRMLTGRVVIDEADRRVIRFDARNLEGSKASVATGVRLGAFQMTLDYVHAEDHVWLPQKSVTFASGRIFFFKVFRVRRTTTYSNYRRFKVDTDERPKS